MTMQYNVEFVQPKSTRHVDANGVARVGQIFVGKVDNTEGVYLPALRFMLVDSLISYLPGLNGGRPDVVGARRMRAWERVNGVPQRSLQSPDMCHSANGVFPHEKYIGQIVPDPRTGADHRIGYELINGRWQAITDMVEVNGVAVPDICRRCPLASWDGGKPPCGTHWRYVIYIFMPDGTGRLSLVRGENTGEDNALRGVKAGSAAARYDGAALPGIRHFFQPTGKFRTVAVPVASLTDGQRRYVVGFCSSQDAKDVVAVQSDWSEIPQGAAYAVIDVPLSPSAPMGRPEVLNDFVDVFPVMMEVTRNAYKVDGRANPTFVPDFKLAETPLTRDEYTQFMEAALDYYSSGMRSVLLRLTTQVSEKIHAAVLSNPTTLALGSGVDI
jgi:hypothetical protein